MKIKDFKVAIELTEDEKITLKMILDKDYGGISKVPDHIMFMGEGNIIIPKSETESFIFLINDESQWTEDLLRFRYDIIMLLRRFVNEPPEPTDN